MLLIITNSNDSASDYLILRLLEREIPFARMNTNNYADSVSVDVYINNEKTDALLRLENGEKITLEEIEGVYFRQPIMPEALFAQNETDRKFAESEFAEALRSFWRVIPKKRWLNFPKNLWSASNKLDQLKAAKNVGFKIPNTLISFSKQRIQKFFEDNENKVIAKAVKHGFIKSDNGMLLAGTQPLSIEFIEHMDCYAKVPMIFQSKINKDFDVRAVVVDDQVFAAKITFQGNREEVDWRLVDLQGGNLEYERIELPGNLEKKCLSIVNYFGLRYSSMDLIIDKEGNCHFIELNPNGQWGWIEQTVGHKIRDKIIDSLIGRK